MTHSLDSLVMAGLDPAIQREASAMPFMDARIKSNQVRA
jgi:hypothetical protein